MGKKIKDLACYFAERCLLLVNQSRPAVLYIAGKVLSVGIIRLLNAIILQFVTLKFMKGGCYHGKWNSKVV